MLVEASYVHFGAVYQCCLLYFIKQSTRRKFQGHFRRSILLLHNLPILCADSLLFSYVESNKIIVLTLAPLFHTLTKKVCHDLVCIIVCFAQSLAIVSVTSFKRLANKIPLSFSMSKYGITLPFTNIFCR